MLYVVDVTCTILLYNTVPLNIQDCRFIIIIFIPKRQSHHKILFQRAMQLPHLLHKGLVVVLLWLSIQRFPTGIGPEMTWVAPHDGTFQFCVLYLPISVQFGCPLILVSQISLPLRSTHQQYPVDFWHCTVLKLSSGLHSGEKTMAKSADHALACTWSLMHRLASSREKSHISYTIWASTVWYILSPQTTSCSVVSSSNTRKQALLAGFHIFPNEVVVARRSIKTSTRHCIFCDHFFYSYDLSVCSCVSRKT